MVLYGLGMYSKLLDSLLGLERKKGVFRNVSPVVPR